jgi:DNA-directed RNA polymerase subunit M/transcription elongation factor TFIIS
MINKETKAGPIVFYCKDCEEIVNAHKAGRKYVYKCAKCGTKNVAFGTEKSIKSFFHVKEEEEKKEEKPKKKEEVKKVLVEEKAEEKK